MKSDTRISRISSRIASARVDNGTACERRVRLPTFSRSGGITHNPASRSISDHFAPITSPVRDAVRSKNSSAARATLSISRSLASEGRGVPVGQGGEIAARNDLAGLAIELAGLLHLGELFGQ